MNGPITYTELVTLYGERQAYAYLRVIERHAAQSAGRSDISGTIIPFDRNLRLQQALAVWSAVEAA